MVCFTVKIFWYNKLKSVWMKRHAAVSLETFVSWRRLLQYRRCENILQSVGSKGGIFDRCRQKAEWKRQACSVPWGGPCSWWGATWRLTVGRSQLRPGDPQRRLRGKTAAGRQSHPLCLRKCTKKYITLPHHRKQNALHTFDSLYIILFNILGSSCNRSKASRSLLQVNALFHTAMSVY